MHSKPIPITWLCLWSWHFSRRGSSWFDWISHAYLWCNFPAKHWLSPDTRNTNHAKIKQ